MMDTRHALEILREETRLLLDFEAATQEMLTCSVERLEGEMGKRERLLSAIQQREEELAALCREAGEEGQILLDAAKGRADWEALPEALREVYGCGQEVRAVLSRFPESEVQARLRLRQEQERMLMKIKAANQGSAAKASRFYAAGTAGTGGGTRLGRA